MDRIFGSRSTMAMIALKIVANDNQLVGFGFNDEFVPFEICENGIDRQPFLRCALFENLNCNARGVDGGNLPAAFGEPYRMTAGPTGHVQSKTGGELRGEAGYERVRFVTGVFAFAVTSVPIRHSATRQ